MGLPGPPAVDAMFVTIVRKRARTTFTCACPPQEKKYYQRDFRKCPNLPSLYCNLYCNTLFFNDSYLSFSCAAIFVVIFQRLAFLMHDPPPLSAVTSNYQYELQLLMSHLQGNLKKVTIANEFQMGEQIRSYNVDNTTTTYIFQH